MFRRLSLALAIAAALSPMAAYPLGLGEIHPKSYLNQAFSADIDLLSVDPEELDTVKVELAPPEVFERAGIPRPFFLSKLDFTPLATADGKAVIRVSSDELIREPFVNFLLEVNWPKGRAVREYTVLLDPPVLTQRRPKPVAAPGVSSRPAGTPAAPASAASGAAAGSLEYGPTKPNDTLWSIAKGMRVEGASVEQVVMALFRYNPNAFIGSNVNRLKVGEVLRLPRADSALEQARTEARAELEEQTEIWRAESQVANPPDAIEEADAEAGENEPTPIALPEPEAGAEASAAAPEPEPTAPGEPELKLVEGDQEATPAVPGGVPGEAESGPEAGSEAASQERALLLAREEAAVARQEASEMRERIGELEDRLGEMQRLMTVQNDRLAQLQDQAEEANKPEELTAPPAAPQGFFERLMSGDKVVLGLLGALGVLLLGLLALLVRGRKREAAAFAAPAQPQPAPRVAERAPAGEFSNQTAALAASAAAVTGAAASGGATPASAPAPVEEPVLDPLAEVDVYVAYGRYEQAEEMLKDEIGRHPERLDFQHKLLEVYAEAGDHESFVAQAEKMSQAGAEEQDPQAWSRVMEMGRTLAPGAALFGGTAAATAAAAGKSTPEPEAEDDFDLDLDLDLAGAGEPEATPAPEAAAAVENLDFELDDFDFGAEEPAAPEVAKREPDSAPEAAEPEAPEQEDEGLSLDEVGGLMEVPAPPPEEPEEPEELVLDTDAFTGVDEEEVETKIDLALAYQDMGDPDDARIILEEVLREGNDDQQQRARELLQALS